jgi:hypothetical protein
LSESGVAGAAQDAKFDTRAVDTLKLTIKPLLTTVKKWLDL